VRQIEAANARRLQWAARGFGALLVSAVFQSGVYLMNKTNISM